MSTNQKEVNQDALYDILDKKFSRRLYKLLCTLERKSRSREFETYRTLRNLYNYYCRSLVNEVKLKPVPVGMQLKEVPLDASQST